eukprot:1246105-Pyramimonas_sp.AAC.1
MSRVARPEDAAHSASVSAALKHALSSSICFHSEGDLAEIPHGSSQLLKGCLLYTSPSPQDRSLS